MLSAVVRTVEGLRRLEQLVAPVAAVRSGLSQQRLFDLMTMPNGMSCILAAGRDWEDIAATPAGTNS